jgi:hypothetical protein
VAVHRLIEVNTGAVAQTDEMKRRVGFDVLEAQAGGESQDREENNEAKGTAYLFFQISRFVLYLKKIAESSQRTSLSWHDADLTKRAIIVKLLGYSSKKQSSVGMIDRPENHHQVGMVCTFLIGLLGLTAFAFGQIHFTEISGLFQVRGHSYFGGQGACWADVNLDGKLDLFVTNEEAQGLAAVPDILYLNYDSFFIDEAVARGASDAYAYGTHGAVFVDLDNDRDFDLFSSTTYGGISPAYNHLYWNNGNGFFTDFTSAIYPAQTVDVSTRGVTAADFDKDGDVDLYFSNPLPDPSPSSSGPLPPQSLPNFCINNGDGTFTAEFRGITWTGFTQGVTAVDYDHDGNIDIAEARWGPPSTIYRNDGTGHFQDIGGLIGLPVTNNVRDNGMCFADVDNDGDLDLAIVGEGRVALYRNSGQSYSLYQIIRSQRSITGYHVAFGDFDNDTFLELYFSGENLYDNDGQGNFALLPAADVGLEDSLKIDDPRGCAVGDFDNDGDLDIYVTNKHGYNRLFRCDLNNSDWLEVEIVSDRWGKAGGIGTKVDLFSAGHLDEMAYLKGHREIQAASGYCGQDMPIVHFGAPSAGGAKYDLKMTFLDGTTKTLTNLTPGQKIQVAFISPPLNFAGIKKENKALFYRETLIELSWEANPLNTDVQKYKIYTVDQGQNLLAELPGNQFSYTLRDMDKTQSYRFAVTAVDSQGLESEPAYTTIDGGTSKERLRRSGLRKS